MRLIDADALRERFVCLIGDDFKASDFVYAIDESPTIDAVPVRRGQWFHYEGTLKCLCCGAEFYDDIMEYCGDAVPKYCPECGADMRGE